MVAFKSNLKEAKNQDMSVCLDLPFTNDTSLESFAYLPSPFLTSFLNRIESGHLPMYVCCCSSQLPDVTLFISAAAFLVFDIEGVFIRAYVCFAVGPSNATSITTQNACLSTQNMDEGQACLVVPGH